MLGSATRTPKGVQQRIPLVEQLGNTPAVRTAAVDLAVLHFTETATRFQRQRLLVAQRRHSNNSPARSCIGHTSVASTTPKNGVLSDTGGTGPTLLRFSAYLPGARSLPRGFRERDARSTNVGRTSTRRRIHSTASRALSDHRVAQHSATTALHPGGMVRHG